MKRAPHNSIREFERASRALARERMQLRLYVAGNAPASIRALANIKRICEERLRGKYVLEVIDVFQQPDHARDDQVLAVPTLIKRSPAPSRRLIGDLSDEKRVVLALGLERPRPRTQPRPAQRHAKDNTPSKK